MSALGAGAHEAWQRQPVPTAAQIPHRVLDALVALLRAAERLQPGLQAAVHLPDGARLCTLACAGVPAALCDALDALDIGGNPALQALHDGAAVQLELMDDGCAPRWPEWADLLRAHRFTACRALPLLDGHGRPLAVWMLYAASAPRAALADAGIDALARTSALLIEQALRQRQRDHEGQQRRDTLRVLAHDLRNLLAPLRTALEVLSRPQTAAAPLQRLQTIMARQLAQLAAMPDELSRLARASGDDDGAADEAQLPLTADEPPAASHDRAGAIAAGAASATADSAGSAAVASTARLDGAPARPPVVPPASAAAGASPRSASPSIDTPRRVLVADDNELVRDSFVELLAAEGFEVRTAADGMQAVEIADQWLPDVVLLDIHMPRLSGLETARRLRASHPPQAMKLLMLSGMSLNDAWVRHAKAAGFDDCLDKSADPRAWLARLRSRSAPH